MLHTCCNYYMKQGFRFASKSCVRAPWALCLSRALQGHMFMVAGCSGAWGLFWGPSNYEDRGCVAVNSKPDHSKIVGGASAVEIFFSLNIKWWHVSFTLLLLNLQDINEPCFSQLRMEFSGVWGYIQPKNQLHCCSKHSTALSHR